MKEPMTESRPSKTPPGVLAELLFRFRGGPRRTWHWIVDRLRDGHYDREFGIHSSPQKQLTRSSLPSAEFVHYQAVSYSDMREVLDSLAIGRSDVFLDFGSGMGRAICLAATHPFRAVVGVELSPGLCEIARHNLHLVQAKLLCRNVRVIEGNAVDYEIPDASSIFFLFNPFRGSVWPKSSKYRPVGTDVAARNTTAFLWNCFQ